jgi:adenine deaminase
MRKQETTVKQLKKRIRAASGTIASDLVLKGGKIVNGVSREMIGGRMAPSMTA